MITTENVQEAAVGFFYDMLAEGNNRYALEGYSDAPFEQVWHYLLTIHEPDHEIWNVAGLRAMYESDYLRAVVGEVNNSLRDAGFQREPVTGMWSRIHSTPASLILERRKKIEDAVAYLGLPKEFLDNWASVEVEVEDGLHCPVTILPSSPMQAIRMRDLLAREEHKEAA